MSETKLTNNSENNFFSNNLDIINGLYFGLKYVGNGIIFRLNLKSQILFGVHSEAGKSIFPPTVFNQLGVLFGNFKLLCHVSFFWLVCLTKLKANFSVCNVTVLIISYNKSLSFDCPCYCHNVLIFFQIECFYRPPYS